MPQSEQISELEELIVGVPSRTAGLDPSSIRSRIEELFGQVLEAEGLTVDRARKVPGAGVFDIATTVEGYPVYFELKFSRVSEADLARVIAITRGAVPPGSRVVILASDVTQAAISYMNRQTTAPVLIWTFTAFLEMIRDDPGAGIRKLLQSIQSQPGTEGEQSDVEIKHYMDESFGKGFWTTVSRSEVSLSILRSVRGLLGSTPATVVLAGTTHTGKSTIANVLFGAAVARTEVYTDVTGQIAVARLPSGLVVVDTPGVGGMNDDFENVTRRYLGLPELTGLAEAKRIPIVDVTDSKKPRTIPGRPLDSRAGNVVTVIVFDLAGGFKRSDYDFLSLARKQNPNVVLVGNKLDLLSDKKAVDAIRLDLKRRAYVDFVAIAAKPQDGKPPIGMDSLVDSVSHQLSENAVRTFNDVLVSNFQIQRNRLIDGSIRRVAARAAVTRAGDTLPGTGMPVHNALLLGLVMRLGIDYDLGGSSVRRSVSEAVRSVFEHIAASSTVKRPGVRDTIKTTTRRATAAGGGAAGGAALGGMIGLLGGPIGVLFGLIFGGMTGAAVGASVSVPQFVKQIWRAPTDTLQELPGGSEGALSTMAFGYALSETLETLARSGGDTIQSKKFAASLKVHYDRLSASIGSEARAILDSEIDEARAFSVLLRL